MPRVKKCAICKKELDMTYSSFKKYCSYECADKGAKKLAKKRRRVKNRTSGTLVLDKKWSALVKERDGHKCRYCHKQVHGLNAHHIFSRSNKATRWYLPNGISLCPAHHVFSLEFSAHKTMVEFVEWLREEQGDKWYNALRKKAKGVNDKDNDYWLNYLKDQENEILNH